MTENPLVSIIVPVYKVENYLDRCVKSILAQSYSNIQLILVDDGSPDNCPRLCDEWAARDSRIQVLHKENGGPSDSRNKGVALAKGDYISFIDSDDYVSADYVEYLLNLLRDNDADIACGYFRLVYDGSENFENQPPEQLEVYDNISFYDALCGRRNMPFATVWGKIYPARLIRDNPFPYGRIHEDEAVVFKYYHQVSKIVLGTREIYAYFYNDKSITHTKTRKNTEDIIWGLEEQYRYFRQVNCPQLSAAAAKRLISTVLYMASKGDGLCREYLSAGRHKPYLNSSAGLKTILRCYGYKLFKTDISLLLHNLLKGKQADDVEGSFYD